MLTEAFKKIQNYLVQQDIKLAPKFEALKRLKFVQIYQRTIEQRNWYHSGILIVNFKQTSHTVPLSLLVTWNKILAAQ